MAVITKEIVEQVKSYKAKFPTMISEDIGKLCGISRSSAQNILNGMYDSYLQDGTSAKTVKSEIPYEDYKRLVTCELAINEMLASTLKSDSDNNILFLSYRRFSEIISRYFPDRFAEKIAELQEAEVEQ